MNWDGQYGAYSMNQDNKNALYSLVQNDNEEHRVETFMALGKLALVDDYRFDIRPEEHDTSLTTPSAPKKEFEDAEALYQPEIETLVRVYPNPSTGQIRVEWQTNTDTQACLVSIYTTQGRLVKSDELLCETYGSHLVNLSEQPNGLYMVNVTFDSGEQFTKRIVIQR